MLVYMPAYKDLQVAFCNVDKLVQGFFHGCEMTLLASWQAGLPAVQPTAARAPGWPVGGATEAEQAHFEAELEINDFPQHARWKVR